MIFITDQRQNLVCLFSGFKKSLLFLPFHPCYAPLLPFYSEYVTTISLGILKVCATGNSPKPDKCGDFLPPLHYTT